MSLGNVLSVAVGLFFIFLILSLTTTSIFEAVASLSRSRARLLRSGLSKLLSGAVMENGAALFARVFGHGLVQSQSKSGLPSYLPAQSFSAALFDVLSDKREGTLFSQIERGVGALSEGYVKQSLAAFIATSGGDLEALRSRVEDWFNGAMDRLSGDYKRHTQVIQLLFGVAVAAVFNIDALNVATALWQDADKRQAVAAAAQSFAATHSSVAGAADTTSQLLQQLTSLPVPMGWAGAPLTRGLSAWAYAVVGWLITGFAISLGAPFWFDLLQNVLNINVRGTGPKPEPSPSS
jgi:hypothetical protein